MKLPLLDRLVLLDLVPTFLAGVVVGSSVLVIGGPVLAATKYISDGVPIAIVAHLVGLSLPPYLALTFPMGVLAATLLGFGRMSADSEATAIYAGGVPFWRIALPAIALGLAASWVGYVINDRIAASANEKIQEMRETILNNGGETTQPFDFPYRPHGKLLFTVHVEKGFDIQRKEMQDVTITLFDASGRPSAIVYADDAQYSGKLKWRLINPVVHYLGEPGLYAPSMWIANGQTYDLKESADSIAFRDRDPDTLSFADLSRQISELKAGGNDGDNSAIRQAEVKLWSKVALPFASLVFAVVGSPIGLRRQRTAKGGYGLAIVIIFGYYVVFTVLTSIASAGHLSPELAAFLPNILGLMAGGALCWRSSI